MTPDPNFTDTEILLAADRFLIGKTTQGFRMQLATNFMAPGKHLSRYWDCERLAEVAIKRGHKVFIKRVPHGPTRVPPAASP